MSNIVIYASMASVVVAAAVAMSLPVILYFYVNNLQQFGMLQ